MKRILLLLAAACASLSASAQTFDAMNLSLYSNFDDTLVLAEPVNSIRYNSVWGYADTATGKEYAILGATSGTYIIDVTNPAQPVKTAFFAGRRDACIWREYKTYRNYLYAVSDDKAPNSLQIFDLADMSNPKKVYDSDSLFERSHTLFIDGDKLYCANVTTTTGRYAMAVYSLADPVRPVLIGSLDQDYPMLTNVHDMFVRNDTVYASCGPDGLNVFRFSNGSFTMLGSLTQYPDQGYNHSSVLTPDGKILVFCDELPSGMRVKVADVSDLTDIKVIALFESSPDATPHNPYLLGNKKLVIAYYKDGVQVYDLVNPSAPMHLGYFDTHPSWNTMPSHPVFGGCWGAYVHLPSSNILASDMQRGLFVLRGDNNILSDQQNVSGPSARVSAYPNPFSDRLHVSLPGIQGPVQLSLTDMLGHTVASASYSQAAPALTLELPAHLSKGVYFLTAAGSGGVSTVKVLK
jgi:choice-of-anchor B domain-containing protein